MVENSSEGAGKGRPTPSRKEAEAARKKRLKEPVNRKARSKKNKAARNVARDRQREALRTGDERYLPAREQGPVRRFCRDFVDSRYNLAEVLLPALVVILLFSFINTPWASYAVLVLWVATILSTAVDEVFMVRKLKRELKARFKPDELRGTTAYAVLRTSQVRRFRMPKPQVKHGEELKKRY